jgi:hypothetical protein
MIEGIKIRQKPVAYLRKVFKHRHLVVRYYKMRVKRCFRCWLCLPIKNLCVTCLIKAWQHRLGRYLIRQGFRWRHRIRVAYHQHPKLYNQVVLPAAGVVLITLLTLNILGFFGPSYQLTPADSKLIGSADASLMKTGQFGYNAKAKAYYLNKSDLSSSSNSFNTNAVTVGNNSSHASYALKLPTTLSNGVTVRDNTSGLAFSLIPEFSTGSG